MLEVVLNATTRERSGKQYVKKLRRGDKIPGIFYAHEEKNIPLIIDTKEVFRLLSSESNLFDIKIDNKKARKCIIKEFQFDPVTQDILHLDIMGVKLKEKIHTSVPIHLTGEAIGVKAEGGTLSQSLRELEISCLPLDIPDHVTVDVTELKVGESIHVKDLKLEKVDIITDTEVVIVSVGITRAAKVEAKPAEPTALEEAKVEQPSEKAEKAS